MINRLRPRSFISGHPANFSGEKAKAKNRLPKASPGLRFLPFAFLLLPFSFPSGTAFFTQNETTAGYITDLDTVPFPTLLAKDPPGSLIYEASATGVIGSPSDADSFTLSLDSGQTITAIVTGLQARIELRDPRGALIAIAGETAPDQPAIIQTAAAAISGTFTITVRGAGGATGGYSLQVILNAAGEVEGITGTNDTPATAQDLSASFIPLRSSLAPASRGAVLGSNAAGPLVPFQTFDFESGEQGFVIDNGPQSGREAGLWHLSVGHGAQTGHSPGTSFYFGQGEGPEGGGNYNVGKTAGAITSAPITLPDNLGVSLSFNYILQREPGELNYDVAAVQISSDGGATFTTIASSTSRTIPESSVWRSASFSLRPFAGQTVLIRFNFNTLDATSNDFEGWYVDDVQLSAPAIWNDYYSFSAGDCDAVSAVVENLSGYVNIFLEDESGMVLAAGAGGVTNYSNGIESFPIETGGTYFLRVSGALSSTYTLVVSRNSSFDTEANDTSATAQSLGLTRGVFGFGGASLGPIQNFDDGLFTGYTAFGPALATVTAAAAHDGPFGVQIADRSGWLYRNDAAVAVRRGDTISAWVQAAGDPAIGRFYFGFGASEAGALSLVLGGNTGSLVLQRNPTLEYYEDLGSVPQLWVPNKWYRFEVAWGIDGGITGRVYDSDGTTLLNTVTGSDATITSGGLAFRGIGLDHFVDSVEKSGMRNDDWYRVTVLGGRLRLETGTPADGAGDFVNTFDPHLELYDSTGQTLLATGVPLEDGRNEAINFSGLPAPVTYLVRLTGEGDTQGEYFLGVKKGDISKRRSDSSRLH